MEIQLVIIKDAKKNSDDENCNQGSPNTPP